MKSNILYITCLFLILLGISCSDTIPVSKEPSEKPVLFSDYADVTIPYNIAPLNFKIENPHAEAFAVLKFGEEKIQVKEKGGQFYLPASDWRKLLKRATGKAIQVKLYAKDKEWLAYPEFSLFVAPEPMDSYLAYRLIEPGYELWNQMGIYQRNLEDYKQSPIMENKYSGQNCMNCHSFCMQNPDKMLFHMRAELPGTYIINGKSVEKLDTKAGEKVQSLVYPSWHPSGNFVAFSVNNTRQAFHMNDKNRIEVYDLSSDVVVYDANKHEVVTDSLIFSDKALETFPTFSPDGKTLYFCSAQAKEIPKDFKSVKYSLCSISFDPETRRFGHQVDTLYSSEQATVQITGAEHKSASFPRVSPDGKQLVFTLSEYGNFSIWHKDADLYRIDLDSGVMHRMDEVNSDDVESYHSWSSNSRWLVFSCRRIYCLYTRRYHVHIDENGKTGKPFVLPQEDPDFYSRFMFSYNIPEFVKGKVEAEVQTIAATARTPGNRIRKGE